VETQGGWRGGEGYVVVLLKFKKSRIVFHYHHQQPVQVASKSPVFLLLVSKCANDFFLVSCDQFVSQRSLLLGFKMEKQCLSRLDMTTILGGRMEISKGRGWSLASHVEVLSWFQLSVQSRVSNRNLSGWQNCRSRWRMNYLHQRCEILGGLGDS